MKNIRLKLVSICAFLLCFQGKAQTLPFNMPEVKEPIFQNESVNIKDFGAVGDGQTMNSEAFKKAIDNCASHGGGTVIIPAGLWLTGPIEMKSNINLHADKGALVIFSRNHDDYASSTGSKPVSPIHGENLTNIAITGDGIFDGSGDTWRPVKKVKTTASQWNDLVSSGGTVKDDTYYPKERGRMIHNYNRTYMVNFSNCKTVLLDGPTFQNSPSFVFCPHNCEDMIVRNIKVLNEWWAQNGDGIDISSGKNIIIKNCFLNVGDDGICMKSSNSPLHKNGEAGLQNVAISDCVVYHAHGGFVIGSNTDGGMHNISVNNCNFMYTDVGLRFKSARGRGGLVDNIYVKNIYMKSIAHEAILFDTYYEKKEKSDVIEKVTERTPKFTDIYIENVFCNGSEQALKMIGLPEMPIRNIHFSNVKISAEAGDIFLKNTENIDLSGFKYIKETN